MYNKSEYLASVDMNHRPHVESCMESLASYGRGDKTFTELGDFLKACVVGDLFGAAARADEINKRYLKEYILFMCNEMPQEKVNLCRNDLYVMRQAILIREATRWDEDGCVYQYDRQLAQFSSVERAKDYIINYLCRTQK